MADKLENQLQQQHSIECAVADLKKLGKNNWTPTLLKTRIEHLKLQWEEFFNGNMLLYSIIPREQRVQLPYFKDDQFQETEEAYLNAMTFMRTQLDEMTSDAVSPTELPGDGQACPSVFGNQFSPCLIPSFDTQSSIDCRIRDPEEFAKNSDHSLSASHERVSSRLAAGSSHGHAAIAPQLSTNLSPPCPICRASHMFRSCPKFKSQSPSSRRKFVRKFSRCCNCLSHSHALRDCPSKNSCRLCHKRHHSLLHEDAPPPNSSTGSEIRTSEVSSHLASTLESSSSDTAPPSPWGHLVSKCMTKNMHDIRAIAPSSEFLQLLSTCMSTRMHVLRALAPSSEFSQLLATFMPKCMHDSRASAPLSEFLQLFLTCMPKRMHVSRALAHFSEFSQLLSMCMPKRMHVPRALAHFLEFSQLFSTCMSKNMHISRALALVDEFLPFFSIFMPERKALHQSFTGPPIAQSTIFFWVISDSLSMHSLDISVARRSCPQPSSGHRISLHHYVGLSKYPPVIPLTIPRLELQAAGFSRIRSHSRTFVLPHLAPPLSRRRTRASDLALSCSRAGATTISHLRTLVRSRSCAYALALVRLRSRASALLCARALAPRPSHFRAPSLTRSRLRLRAFAIVPPITHFRTLALVRLRFRAQHSRALELLRLCSRAFAPRPSHFRALALTFPRFRAAALAPPLLRTRASALAHPLSRLRAFQSSCPRSVKAGGPQRHFASFQFVIYNFHGGRHSNFYSLGLACAGIVTRIPSNA